MEAVGFGVLQALQIQNCRQLLPDTLKIHAWSLTTPLEKAQCKDLFWLLRIFPTNVDLRQNLLLDLVLILISKFLPDHLWILVWMQPTKQLSWALVYAGGVVKNVRYEASKTT